MTAVDELLDELVAHAFDVERAPAREMQQCLLALRRADEAAFAARDGLAFEAHDRRAALGTRLRQVPGTRARGPPLGQRAHDLRDHVAGAAHDDRVADPQVAPADLVLVVQRDVGDRRAADEHGFESRDRRDRAGAADLHVDRDEPCRHFLAAGTCARSPSAARACEIRARAGARGSRPCRRRRRSRTAARGGGPPRPGRTPRVRRPPARPANRG